MHLNIDPEVSQKVIQDIFNAIVITLQSIKSKTDKKCSLKYLSKKESQESVLRKEPMLIKKLISVSNINKIHCGLHF